MGKGPYVNGARIDELGNYHLCQFTEDGVTYNSVEQYFQSKKCKGHNLLALSPQQCAVAGRRVELPGDWESVKVGVMERANRLKYEQCERLKELLCSTAPHRLFFCEHDKQDYWDHENERILTELRASFLT
jgi:predicted NAD-dependent protein-ADP-ribosyltransferase YbiA (DUF1768 family)